MVIDSSIGIYRTNIDNSVIAENIIDAIHTNYPESKANFDLEDCDKILRVENISGKSQDKIIKGFVAQLGYKIEDLTE